MARTNAGHPLKGSAEDSASRAKDRASQAKHRAGNVAKRLQALRVLMKEHRLDVYLVPSADEHFNEYLPPNKARREAMSGFDGSAGELLITLDSAHLFVDSRYHLQADQQTEAGLFTVHKLGLAGAKEPTGWLKELEEREGSLRVGVDPFLVTLNQARTLADSLNGETSGTVPVSGNLVDRVWHDRPSASLNPVYPLPQTLTGEGVADKLTRIREAMAEAGASALVLSRLDDIAWTTNLRGSDIPYNPVFEAYLLVEADQAHCFTDNPLEDAARAALEGLVTIHPYTGFTTALEALGRKERTVWIDPASASDGIKLALGDADLISITPNPVVGFKAAKNPVEIQAARDAHVRSGLAKVRAFATLQRWLDDGKIVSEAGFSDLLAGEYAREPGYADLSFNTICGFGENGAIVHYGTPNPEKMLSPGGLLLVDSGVQLAGATTDDTRTIAIGQPDDVQKARFTAVLRGHIRMAMQVFPQGATGAVLDALARAPLWNQGLDYGHGTGHGVGAFLNVHEGPQGITARSRVPLQPGMVVSNEPGYYLDGWGGIRCENLYVVEEAPDMPAHPAGQTWLRLSALTLIPFDTTLIDVEQMTHEERAWLKAYHQQVQETLAPHLNTEDRQWLRQACQLP